MRLSRANIPLASEDRTHSQAISPSPHYNLAPHFWPGFINLQHFCHSRWRNPVRLSKSGQEMGPGHDVRLEEGAEFGTRRRWQHGDPGVAGEEPVLTLHGMAVFSLLVLWRRHLLDRGDDQALVRVGRAASGTCRIAAAADEGLIRLRGTRAADGPDPRSARGATCAPWSTPSGTPPPVPAAEIWPRRRACRDPSDRRQETTSRGPSASEETLPPRAPTPAGGRCRTLKPAVEPSAAKPPVRGSPNTQNRRASEARPSARCTNPPSRTALQNPKVQPSAPPNQLRSCYPKERRASRTFSQPALTRQGNGAYTF